MLGKLVTRSAALPLIIATAALVQANRGFPRIDSVYPGAVTRGKTTEVTLTGHYNLRNVTRIVFQGEGLSATVSEGAELKHPKPPPAEEQETLKIKVTVAENAAPGVREFRVLTQGSLSTVANLMVTDIEAINESEPNDSAEEAQRIQIPQVINGWVNKEADNDVYQFRAKAGDRICFVIHAARLQRASPILAKGFSNLVLSLRDDKDQEVVALGYLQEQDPLLFHAFERDGTYYLHVREANYGNGEGRWWYSLSALTSPQITSVFPLAVKAGEKVRVYPRGFNLEGLEETEIQVPETAKDRWELLLRSARGTSNPVILRVTDLPQFQKSAESKPAFIRLPVGINGCLSKDGEVDRYHFRARKGDRLEFEVEAHQYGSALDALLELRDVKGRLLAAQDDQVTTVGMPLSGEEIPYPVEKDPRLEWMAPADGEYEITIRDANFFGSANHIYHLSAKLQEGDFALLLDDNRMPLGPGESIARLVTLERRNGFSGEVEISVRNLPPGVTAEETLIPSALDQATLVLTAATDAKMDVRDVEVVGMATIREASGRARQIERIARAFAPYGPPGYTKFEPTHSAAVAVVEGADIILESFPKEVTLHAGESVTLSIKVARNNYAGPVELNMIVQQQQVQQFNKLPQGIVFDETGSQSKTLLGENETEGRVTLRALPDAMPLENLSMSVLGQISYDRIVRTRTAARFRLTVKVNDPAHVSQKSPN